MSSADESQISSAFNGRAESLYRLHEAYSAAVVASGGGRAAGVALACAQREVTKAYMQHRNVAARTGASHGLPLHRLQSVQNFMGLMLQEQRNQNAILADVLGAMRGIVTRMGDPDDDDDGGALPVTPGRSSGVGSTPRWRKGARAVDEEEDREDNESSLDFDSTA
ncbi:hypothetical protein LTR66_000840 [Elasticomyces elasticus]|nr:hypothetical protein LTR66_000840 [Elasticomyces elasticus]KAK5011508.1 hypothetical protein LTR28_001046 [Elasticomyces elasticus]